MEIHASLPKRKPQRKRTKKQASDVVPRKSARLASRLNQDQDQEAAVSAAGGQEAAAADSPAAEQEAAVAAAAEGHKSTKSPAGGQEAGALCALSLVADYSSDTSQE